MTGSLVDIVEASARDYPDAAALQFFGRETSYRALHEQIDRAAAGLEASASGRATPSRSCCRTARSTSSPSTRSCGWAPSSSSTTRSTRRASCASSSRTTARSTRSCGRKVVATVQEFPADLARDGPRLGRRHQGDAVPHPAGARLPIAKARESREALHERVSRHGVVGGRRRRGAAAGIPPEARAPTTSRSSSTRAARRARRRAPR